MKNGTTNVLFVAAFAALFTGCPPPNNMDPDSGPMPMEDAYVPPGTDAGVDAYVPPGDDAGPVDCGIGTRMCTSHDECGVHFGRMDRCVYGCCTSWTNPLPEGYCNDDSAAVDCGGPRFTCRDHRCTLIPGICNPEMIATGTLGCTSCACDMPEWMTAACGERPELCRTGESMRNTCGMTAGTNRCGFDLPLEGGTTGNMTPYVGGFSDLCQRAISHTTWGVVATGNLFCVESMTVNGQLTMLFTDSIGGSGCEIAGSAAPWAGSFTCQRVGGVDVCTSSASNADMPSERNVRMTFASDCLTARFATFSGATLMSETELSFSTFR
jgi:hypothetical protein